MPKKTKKKPFELFFVSLRIVSEKMEETLSERQSLKLRNGKSLQNSVKKGLRAFGMAAMTSGAERERSIEL